MTQIHKDKAERINAFRTTCRERIHPFRKITENYRQESNGKYRRCFNGRNRK